LGKSAQLSSGTKMFGKDRRTDLKTVCAPGPPDGRQLDRDSGNSFGCAGLGAVSSRTLSLGGMVYDQSSSSNCNPDMGTR
jgi:hypothetical protein